MKKIFQIIGLVSLICFSFFYTEKTIHVIKDQDVLMVKIKKESENYNLEVHPAIIDKDSIIPGLVGKQVDLIKSYDIMKKIGVYDASLYKYKTINPEKTLNQNLDKYIISGNQNKNMISLIFIVKDSIKINKIISILDKYQIKGNFFVDSYWFENNNDLVSYLINNKHVVGNLGQNLDYTKSEFVWMNSIIKKISKQKYGYCYSEEENEVNLKTCKLQKNYTIKTSIILKDNYVIRIKENIKPGALVSLLVNPSLEKELELLIQYINSKGYKIETLTNHLKESR